MSTDEPGKFSAASELVPISAAGIVEALSSFRRAGKLNTPASIDCRLFPIFTVASSKVLVLLLSASRQAALKSRSDFTAATLAGGEITVASEDSVVLLSSALVEVSLSQTLPLMNRSKASWIKILGSPI